MEHKSYFTYADVVSENENHLTNNGTFQSQCICTLDEEQKSVKISIEVAF